MVDVELELIPEPCGLLQDPPRRPPTAVGCATLPPRDSYPRRHNKTRRIALALLAVILTMTALPLATSASAPRAVAASGLVAVSVDVGLQAVSASIHPWREIVAPRARRFLHYAGVWPERFSKHRESEPARASRQSAFFVAREKRSFHRRRRGRPNA